MIQKLHNSLIANSIYICSLILPLSCSAVADSWVRCDVCTAAQSETTAIASGPDQTVVIFSARGNTAYVYHTQTEVAGDGCQPLRPGDTGGQKALRAKNAAAVSAGNCSYVTKAYPTTLDTDQQQLVSAFHGVYVETSGTMQKVATVNIADIPNVPSGPGPVANDPGGITAYDVANNLIVQNQLRTAVTNYVDSLSGQLNHLFSTIFNEYNIRFSGAELEFNLVITLQDGSKVQFDFTLHKPKPELVSSEDPNGLPVMIIGAGTAPQYIGDHGFNSNRDLTNFLNNAALNGVQIVDHHIGGLSAHCSGRINEDGTVVVTCSMF